MSRKSAPISPPVPPKPRLYLGYKSTRTGGERKSDEPYSCRSPEHVSVNFKSLSRESGSFFGHNIEVSPEVYAADVVHIVVVRYQSGDSFGTTYGNWTVWAATASEDEALTIAQSIEDGSLVEESRKNKSSWTHFPWEGHFNRLEGIEIHSFRVTQTPSSGVIHNVTIHRH